MACDDRKKSVKQPRDGKKKKIAGFTGRKKEETWQLVRLKNHHRVMTNSLKHTNKIDSLCI
jgi:hypothetical protein